MILYQFWVEVVEKKRGLVNGKVTENSQKRSDV